MRSKSAMERIFAEQKANFANTEHKNCQTGNELDSAWNLTFRSLVFDRLNLVFTGHGGEDSVHDELCWEKCEPNLKSLCENWGDVTVTVEVEALGSVCESLDGV